MGKDESTLEPDGISLSDNRHDKVARCLCHELIEAWSYFAELKLEHPQITALEGLLYETLRENREFVRFVQWTRWR